MYIIISVNYGEVTMVINDIFEVLRIRKVIELLQYFLISRLGYGLVVLIKTKLTKSLILAAKA
jgi:hypothetical protein